MTEQWIDIAGYEELYQISNFGNVLSLKYGKIKLLKGAVNNYGYRQVNLSKDKVVKSFKVHQLVATHFLGHKVNGYESVINHINFDKQNNTITNLEIITARENTNKKHLKASSNSTGVSWHKGKSKWISQIYYNGKLKFLGYFKTEIEASNAYQNELLTISTKPLLVAGAVNQTKMSELKQINQSELQVGKLYCDTPRLHGFNTVIMRYIGKIKGSHNFKYISGNSEYINEGDDIIRLAHYTKEPNWYWEVPKVNADVIEEALGSTCH